MKDEWCINTINTVETIREDVPDDIFITCGSFEERFLGIPKKFKDYSPKYFILFKFTEENSVREKRVKEMHDMLNLNESSKNYIMIKVEHGKSFQAIIEFHNFILKKKISMRKSYITVDITTFTKHLLLNLMFYLIYFLSDKKIRAFYTLPERYASPDEGWLSFGIKNINIPPFYWNEWSSIKDNLLIILLGFEEMRAWSLVDKFSADLNWLFATNPGSKPKWDNYCEDYNARLLNVIPFIDTISALNPNDIEITLSKYLKKDIIDNYNIFLSPLSTKPQLIGVIKFLVKNPNIPINIVTTTVEHNTPYYSRGISDSFEYYLPLRSLDKNHILEF